MWQVDYANRTLYNHSEWRHALSLLGAVGTTVAGLAMSESGGDGISSKTRWPTTDQLYQGYTGVGGTQGTHEVGYTG